LKPVEQRWFYSEPLATRLSSCFGNSFLLDGIPPEDFSSVFPPGKGRSDRRPVGLTSNLPLDGEHTSFCPADMGPGKGANLLSLLPRVSRTGRNARSILFQELAQSELCNPPLLNVVPCTVFPPLPDWGCEIEPPSFSHSCCIDEGGSEESAQGDERWCRSRIRSFKLFCSFLLNIPFGFSFLSNGDSRSLWESP